MDKALGYSVFTEASTFEELKTMVQDAVNCHFGHIVTKCVLLACG
jgi:hypothetical protein